MFTPHMDTGDHVVVINADKVKLSGVRRTVRSTIATPAIPAASSSAPWHKFARENGPEMLIRKAVQRMVPRGPLGRDQLRKLHVYTGTEHPHDAQQPDVLDVAALNPKNKRSS